MLVSEFGTQREKGVFSLSNSLSPTGLVRENRPRTSEKGTALCHTAHDNLHVLFKYLVTGGSRGFRCLTWLRAGAAGPLGAQFSSREAVAASRSTVCAFRSVPRGSEQGWAAPFLFRAGCGWGTPAVWLRFARPRGLSRAGCVHLRPPGPPRPRGGRPPAPPSAWQLGSAPAPQGGGARCLLFARPAAAAAPPPREKKGGPKSWMGWRRQTALPIPLPLGAQSAGSEGNPPARAMWSR
ncbi:unnamed protein product [Lepidochelys olivacea]